MATLTGKLTDVTGHPPESIASITVKAPSARIGSGTEVITSSPATVDFDSSTGDITISDLTGGLSWLYIEGNGWSDSIALAVAEGMITLVEAIANAAGIPGLVDLIALLLDLQNRIDDIAQDAVDEAAEGIKEYVDDSVFFRGYISGPVDIQSLAPGLYEVRDTSAAVANGLPGGLPGELFVHWQYASGLRKRYKYETGNAGSYQLHRMSYYNGTWTDWVLELEATKPYFRGFVPAGVHIEDMVGYDWTGVWRFDSGQAAEWDMPSSAGGYIEVMATSTSTLHKVDAMDTPIENYQRRWYAGSWVGGWERQGGATTPGSPDIEVDEYTVATTKSIADYLVPTAIDPTLTYETDRAALVSELKSRIGVPSLGNAGGVALVFDHGTTNFFERIWPALKARNIPATLALCPEIHLDGKGDALHTASNETIKQAVDEGLVIACHSGDHGGATGFFEVHRQMVTSKKKLEEKLDTTVDTWVQPGYELSLGDYDGFGVGISDARYTDFYAGRLLQQTYPVITGASGAPLPKVYAGDADLPVGIRRSRIERLGDDEVVKGYINEIIASKGKHVTYIHPYALVGNDTYHSIQDYIDFLDWLVDRRDAGDLVLLTLPQLAIARP